MSESDYDPWAVMQSLGATPVSRGDKKGVSVHRGKNWFALWEPSKREAANGHIGFWKSSANRHGFSGVSPLYVQLSADDINCILDYDYSKDPWVSPLHERYRAKLEGCQGMPEYLILSSWSSSADAFRSSYDFDDYGWRLEWEGDHGDYSTVGITSVGFVPLRTPCVQRTGWQINMRWTTEPVTAEDIESLAAVMRKRERRE